MFLHLSVSHSVHREGGVCLSGCWDTRPPPGQTPPEQTPPPCAMHAGRYGQQAGGTRPTGMHTC